MRRSRNANIGGFSRREVIGAPALRDRRRNSSTRSSSSNAATPVLAVPASHRRLRTLSASISTKTSSAGAGETLSTRSGNRWSVLAELYRAYEGQPVERRFVSLRIDTPAQPLGHGGDGRVHTPDHRLWR